MDFVDTWGAGLVTVKLETRRLPYRLTERYGNCMRRRRFWSRWVADMEHNRALKNAEYLIELIRDAEPQRISEPLL